MYHLTQAENVVCTASVGKVFILFPDAIVSEVGARSSSTSQNGQQTYAA